MTPTESKKPNPIAGIFLTVFLDLLSFGIFIPDLQLRGEHVIREFLGSKAPESTVAIGIALVLSLYSIASFIAFIIFAFSVALILVTWFAMRMLNDGGIGKEELTQFAGLVWKTSDCWTSSSSNSHGTRLTLPFPKDSEKQSEKSNRFGVNRTSFIRSHLGN